MAHSRLVEIFRYAVLFTVKEDGMHPIKSMPLLIIVAFCIPLASGCKTFSAQGLNGSGPKLSLRNSSPSRKRKPRNINNMNSRQRQAVIDQVDSAADAQGPQDDTTGGISLDDISLAKTTVHVDADMDIEEIERESDSQLPSIVESAVHPFSGITKPITLSDQTANASPPSGTTGSAQGFNTLNATSSIAGGNRPIKASGPDRAEGTPDRSTTDLEAAPLNSSAIVGIDDNDLPLMRITAQTESSSSKDPIAIKTDRLFSRPREIEIETSTPPLSNANPGDQEQDQLATASHESPEASQLTTTQPGVQTVAHQEPANTPIENSPPGRSDAATEFVNQSNRTRSPQTSNPTVTAESFTRTTIMNAGPPRETAGSESTAWDQPLQVAIARLEAEAQAAGQPLTGNQQVRLELLRIIAGERIEEAEALTHDNQKLEDYWKHQLSAIDEMLAQQDADSPTKASTIANQQRSMTLASKHLERAQSELADIATLNIAKCVFASEVRGFGQFTELPAIYEPGQQVLLYSELENYSLKQGEISGKPQLIAELQGQFSIIDEMNRVVYQYQYQPVQDFSERRRNDFYMFFPVTMPDLPPGQYRLHLVVDDLIGNKVASYREAMNFTMQGRTRSPQPQATASRPPPRFVRPESATVPKLAQQLNAQAEAARQAEELKAQASPPVRMPIVEQGNQPLPLNADKTNAPRPAEQRQSQLPSKPPLATGKSSLPREIQPSGTQRR